MKSPRVLLSFFAALFSIAPFAGAQAGTDAAVVTVQGLRVSANQGSFKAAQYAADGSLILLYDQGDGVRLLKTDASAANVTAQAQTGSAGDSGVALALDPAGNIYIAGTSTSGRLAGTSGVVFPSPADSTTNSFLAKFDSNLHLVFLSFLGAGRSAVSGIAATSDAVFVTGVTYSAAFPVTSGALQTAPSTGSYGNGFVERFSTDGTVLRYATYLTGAGGDTVPAGLAVNSADNAFITGQTSAAGYPTVAALQPSLIGSTSGFLTELSPAGSSLIFSTFIAGTGLTGIAFDAGTSTLLLAGNVALGQFPVATVSAPIANTPYQTFLRLSADGQALTQSVLLVPGTESFVAPGPNGTAWISGSLGTPLFNTSFPAASRIGDSFLLHVTQNSTVDQLLRLGGSPTTNPEFATLTSEVAAPAISRDGSSITVPGTVTAIVDASLQGTQRFDLALTTPTSALPSSVLDFLPTNCSTTVQCRGTGGLLSLLRTGGSNETTTLTLSSGDSPNLTLRNAGASAATDVAITAPGYIVASDCSGTLVPLAQCGITLSGSGSGPLTVTSSNASPVSFPLTSTVAGPGALAFDVPELDFGIVTADSSPVLRTLTVTNLSNTVQSFTSAADAAPTSPPYSLAETGSTCGGGAGKHTIPGNSDCTITLGLSASPLSSNDGPVRAFWTVGSSDVVLTGLTQAAALIVSAAEIDFGVQLTGSTAQQPRYLYLSNYSAAAIAHAPVSLPANSSFGVTDACPSTLEPESVCQIALTYTGTNAPARDSTTLLLDEGLDVLVTGETLAPPAPGEVSDSQLSLSSTSLSFATPVVATEVSSETEIVSVTNNGGTAVPFAVSVTPEFRFSDNCGATLNPGTTCDLAVQFAPSQPGVREGLLSLATGSGFDPILVSLSGTGSALLAPNNGLLALGQTAVGEPTVNWYKLQAAVGTLTASVTGSAFGVAVVEDVGTGHGSLAADAFTQTATAACANCWLGVQFDPQAAGPASSILTLLTVAGGNPDLVSVSGTGVAVQGLVLSALNSNFGTVPVASSSAPVVFTLANLLAPATAVTITGVTVTGDFTILTNTTGGASCSGLLASTASCYLEVSLTPTAAGIRSGTLTVQTSSGNATALLSGTGTSSPGLAVSPIALNFNNAPGTAGTRQTLTLANTSSSALAIGVVTSSNDAFTAATPCTTLAAGAACTVAVTFAPGATEVTGTLSIPVSTTIDGLSSTVTYAIPLTGAYTSNGTGLLLLPGEVDYGAQASGSIGQTRQFTLTNTSQTVEAVSLTVPAQFPLAAPFTCNTLAPGATCAFSVSYLPETGGALTGSLFATATTSGSSPAQAIGYLLGYGTASGNLTISGQQGPSASVDFGAVNSGESAQQSLTLTNSGTGNLNIRRVAAGPPFTAMTDCGGTLSPGGSCTVTTTYSPVFQLPASATSLLPRTDTGTLSIESDAASSPDMLNLLGTVNPVVAGSITSTTLLASYQLSEGALTFANTQVGDRSAPQTVTLLNTGTQTLSIGAVLAPQDFAVTTTCASLLPGAICSISVTFTPGTDGTATVRAGTLEIQSNALNALEMVSLLGMSTAAPLQISPGALDFGTVDVPGSDQLPVTVTNTASLPITFGQATATGDYSVAAGTCPAAGAALPAGQSCALAVIFTPSATGTRLGTANVATDATELPLTVALTGVGAEARLQVSPGTLAFGSISVGASSILTLNLQNAGSGSVAGITTAISGANAADFAVTTPCPTTTLSPVAGCSLEVTFAPSASGNRAATLVITSSDPAGPITIPLTGAGTQPGSLLLTVGGGSSASVTVAAGMPATYPLMLAPQNGFSGMAALTCTPLAAAPYAGCSLLSSQVNLNAGTQGSIATITTVNGAVTSSGQFAALGVLLLAPLSWMLRRRGIHNVQKLVALCMLLVAGAACCCTIGCGGPGNDGLNLTPAGTYKYQVTANSVSGAATSSTVTLTLVVQ